MPTLSSLPLIIPALSRRKGLSRKSAPAYSNQFSNYETILDRRTAIARILQLARKGDIVLIAGKGHETYQEIDGEKIPFDDRTVVRELL